MTELKGHHSCSGMTKHHAQQLQRRRLLALLWCTALCCKQLAAGSLENGLPPNLNSLAALSSTDGARPSSRALLQNVVAVDPNQQQGSAGLGGPGVVVINPTDDSWSPGKHISQLAERIAAAREAKQQAAGPNVIVVPNQQPQPQLAAQAVQPQQAAPGFTSLGSGVNIATSTPLSLSNPIDIFIPTLSKQGFGFLGGGGLFGRRRLMQQVVQVPADGVSSPGWYPGRHLEGLLDRFKAGKQGAPNVIVVPGQQPQPQLAAQAVQPQQAGPGFTSVGAGVNIATSTPISLSNPIDIFTPQIRKEGFGFLGGGLFGGFGRRRHN